MATISPAVPYALSGPMWRFALFCAAVMCFTSSWDVFLTIQAGGTFRVCQVVATVLFLLAVMQVIRAGLLPTLGLGSAGLWLVFQICFIPATDFLPRSFGYCFWLLLDLAMMFTFVQIFGGCLNRLIALLRWYTWSFACVAGFGVVQFLLPIFGGPSPLVQQWWVAGILPRANGFSYEPSYFATYMLMGFVFVRSLRRSRSEVLPMRKLQIVSQLCGIAIVLSSSRMGIIFLLLEIVLPGLGSWVKLSRDVLRSRLSAVTLRRVVPSAIMLAVVGTLGVACASVLEQNPAVILLFLNGTGLSNTAAHSVIQREDAFGDTLSVFAQHPIVGRSLGGVASAIAELHGETITSFEQSKQFEGMSIYAEVLAASGVLGIIPFICFSVSVIRKPIVLSHSADPLVSGILRASVRSLVYGLLILQFNQNILRPYLWLHLAVLASAYSVGMRAARYARSVRSTTSHTCFL